MPVRFAEPLVDQLDKAVLLERNREQRTGIAFVKHQRIRERTLGVVEELQNRHVESRCLAVIEEDLNPCTRLLLAADTHEYSVDAAGACGIEEDVAARAIRCWFHDVLVVRAVAIATTAIPGTRHGGVRCLQFRQVVYYAEAIEEECQVTNRCLILCFSRRNEDSNQRQPTPSNSFEHCRGPSNVLGVWSRTRGRGRNLPRTLHPSAEALASHA